MARVTDMTKPATVAHAARSTRLRATPRRAERGQVLLIVAMMALLAAALWLLGWRATHDAIRNERFNVLRDQREATVNTALAEAVDVLKTGRPPYDPYLAVVPLRWEEQVYLCTLEFISLGDADHWAVESRLSTDLEKTTLPLLPLNF